MVLCAALRFNLDGHVIVLPCVRHGDGFELIKQLGIKKGMSNVEQGFICTDGGFQNREAAYKEAKFCGQLPQTVLWYKDDRGDTELYSEDLY